MAGMANGCHIHGRPNPSNMVECKHRISFFLISDHYKIPSFLIKIIVLFFYQIKRGNVEGLNPLMFIFALIANATYVARFDLSSQCSPFLLLLYLKLRFINGCFNSILVRTTEWGNIKPNMPWLLDAVVCVALDLFVSFSWLISGLI